MIIVKMLNNPRMKDNISAFDLAFKLKPTIIGIVGIMQGDNIEITPVKNEIIGIISILKTLLNHNYFPLISFKCAKYSSGGSYPSILPNSFAFSSKITVVGVP